MNRILPHIVAFMAGLAVVCWIGAGYAGANALALGVTLVIGAFYVTGAFELQRYRQATASLAHAVSKLSESPASLGHWLDTLPAGLRDAVRLRVEGERVTLPAPTLTPYLVGLLVLLGMFGTFLGMVATLRGTGMALEGATDLQAMRASLAAPVKGLGFAFGTSVAGVATSAMLGLIAALCRRERIEAVRQLDTRIATTLRPFSRSHQRDEMFRLVQRQAEVMPTLVDRLQDMMATMERQSRTLAERLAASQEAFHGSTEATYTRLASSVEESLKTSIADSARVVSAVVEPAVRETMAGLAHEMSALRDSVSGAVRQQLEGISTEFATTTANVADIWQQALGEHRHASETLTRDLRQSLDTFGEALVRENQQALARTSSSFAAQSTSLAAAVTQSHADLQVQLQARDEQRLTAWTDALGAMAAAIATQTQAQASETIAEVSRLVEATTAAPKAAAAIIEELREKLSEGLVRDNAMLAERGRLLASLETLLDAVNHASTDQRVAVDGLVTTTAELLERVGARFAESVESETERMATIAAQVSCSAVETASLGESFGAAVQVFSDANGQLVAHLQRIEAALDKSMARSDEQLAYYVAQAREVVDLSMLSQKQILEDLQRLAAPGAANGPGAEAA
ncbi:DUF802 domain-containing protein [Cupriavidus campinensis]|uniref:DUF802 domain-containing protein n=1 Tax=Cupriavidus campinensis TaxID=151783 RepID=A0AAE9HXQ4_9BURK|nr:DUF802 domain-containing protein [Cupriavidus campinensis]URF03829.1 DUF802 domain-containing protein [Cupriavidus campinensis]